MKQKPKFVLVIPVEKSTGNTAPAIGTSVTYNHSIDELSTTDKSRAINEAKSKSRFGESKLYDFRIKEQSA